MKKLGFIYFLISGISLICLFVFRLLIQGWVPYLWVPLIFFVVFLFLGAWSVRGVYKEFFLLKTTKQGLSMGAMISLVLVLLVAINFLGARKTKTFDFSSAQQNTLSDQSKQLMKTVAGELKIFFFYKEGVEGLSQTRRAFQDLIKKYQDEGPSIQLRFVEVNQNPKLAEDYGVNKGTGMVFVEYQGRRTKIDKIDEQELTGAIVKLLREKDKKVYYVIGHGEGNLEESKEPSGMNAFKKLLEGSRYSVNPIRLSQTGDVPSDADILAIVGPSQAFLDSEITAVEKYLERGGRLFLTLRPSGHSGLETVIRRMGLTLHKDVVVQVMKTQLGNAVNPKVTPVSDFSKTNVITKPFTNGGFVVMRLPGSLTMSSPIPSGMTVEPMVRTDQNSMAFPDTSFSGDAKAGPFITGVLVKGQWESSKKGTDEAVRPFEAVVYSDSEFLANELLYRNLNRDLVLNSIAYLGDEQQIISITPKEVGVTEMTMTETNFYLFIFGFIIPLPLILLVASGTLWYRRRYA